LWTTESLRLLRELALARFPVAQIAAALGRSESAIRNKAGMHGISLTTAARSFAAEAEFHGKDRRT
jgi:hypothetical protein